MSVEVKNLTKKFGSQTAVNNISFSVGKGEITGFLGPNGAGKSTTMRMITGYLPADGGEITVSGLPASPENMGFRKKIGYLPEGNPHYYEMYIKEYLQFVANIHGVKNAKQRIAEVIKTVGLTPEAHKKIGQLSKGYKQRVGIAAALVHDPEVLILDEPTSGLDPNQIVEIRNVIKGLSANKTVLFSTHIMQEVEAICNRVIIINKGNIVANDTVENLQKGNGKAQVTVSFNAAADETLLKQMAGVEGVSPSENNTYLLSTFNADAVKKELLQFAITHQLDITSLQTGNRSLEDVFRSLTA